MTDADRLSALLGRLTREEVAAVAGFLGDTAQAVVERNLLPLSNTFGKVLTAFENIQAGQAMMLRQAEGAIQAISALGAAIAEQPSIDAKRLLEAFDRQVEKLDHDIALPRAVLELRAELVRASLAR